jgi:hypothetical protein
MGPVIGAVMGAGAGVSGMGIKGGPLWIIGVGLMSIGAAAGGEQFGSCGWAGYGGPNMSFGAAWVTPQVHHIWHARVVSRNRFGRNR